MENENFSQNTSGLFSRLKPHALVIFLGCIGLLLIGYGMTMFWGSQSASSDISFDTQRPQKASVKNFEEKLMVDVSGAVVKPGVYTLKADSRVIDAITAAGGYAPDIDKTKTQHLLNLAAKVTDGMKIYVPKIGESAEQTSSGGPADILGSSTGGLVSINNGTAGDLDTLPGVGKVTAEKIINARPYSSIDELLSKKIVSSSVFEKIREKISL